MLNAIGTDGCTTTHGGVVKATQFTATHHGKPMLKTGDGFQCPKCKTWSTIMQGSGLLSWHGAKVALESDKFTCGAELVAQQSTATVEQGNIQVTTYDANGNIIDSKPIDETGNENLMAGPGTGDHWTVPFVNASEARALKPGEEQLLRKIFRNSIKYNEFGIRKAEMIKDRSAVINGDIYFDDSDYLEDMSKGNGYQRHLLVHEATHIWQQQNGYWTTVNALGLQGLYELHLYDPYPYDIIQWTPLSKYNMEQQADMIADYYSLTQNSDRYFSESGEKLRNRQLLREALSSFIQEPDPKNNNSLLPE